MNFPDWAFQERLVVFDVETTGLDRRRHRVIELGVKWIEGGKTVMNLSMLLDPQVHVPREITDLTGITNDDVAGRPVFGDIVEFVEDILAPPSVLIAYNNGFDLAFLNNEAERCGKQLEISDRVIDPFKWVRAVDRGSCRLSDACERRGIESDGAHRALADCVMTLKLLGALSLPDDLDEALDVQSRLKKAK